MLDDAPPLWVPIDTTSLSIFEHVPIVIPPDIGLDGEWEIALLLFSCLGLGVKFVSECISPAWPKTEDNPSVRSDVKHSSYTVLKLFLAFELDCSFLGLMLGIIAFLPCLAREDCSFLRLMILVSNLDVPLNNS